MNSVRTLGRAGGLASFVLFLALLLAACGGGSSGVATPGTEPPTQPEPGEPGEPGEPSEPPGEPTCEVADYDSTFEALHARVFEPNCVACHSGDSPSGDLDLSADVACRNIVEQPSKSSSNLLIRTGDKSGSHLFQKVAAWSDSSIVLPGGGPMPPQGPIAEDDLAFLQWWIGQGNPCEDGGTLAETEQFVEGCLNEPNPVAIRPLEAPPPGEGVQISMPAFSLEPSSEVEVCFCTYFDVRDQTPDEFKTPDGHYLFWSQSEIRQNPVSHHLLIQTPAENLFQGQSVDPDTFSDWACRGGPSDGEACDPVADECGSGVCATPMVGTTACSGYAPGNGTITATFAGTQTAQSKTVLDPGVFQFAPTHGVVCWNSHAFNLTTQEAEVVARLNYTFAKEQIYQARGINTSGTFGVPDLIARGAKAYTKNTLCWSETLPRGARVYSANSHNHKRGERAWWTDADGETVIYENRFYNDPPDVHFAPPLEYDSEDPAERTLEFCTTYNNGVDEDGNPDPETVTRASRIPYGVGGPGSRGIGMCEPYACVNEGADFTINCDDGVRNQKGDDAACDTSPGAGDGFCDACSIMGGVTTENEMGQGSLQFYVVEPEDG